MVRLMLISLLLYFIVVTTGSIDFQRSDMSPLNRNLKTNEKFSLIPGDSGTETYYSGFLRTDTYDLVIGSWIQAQSLVIGSCFGLGTLGNFGSLNRIKISKTNVRVTRYMQTYGNNNCSGLPGKSETITEFLHSKRGNLEIQRSHVVTLPKAMELIPSDSNGLVIR